MLLNNVADKLVFKFLSKINYGYLELTTFDGNVSVSYTHLRAHET